VNVQRTDMDPDDPAFWFPQCYWLEREGGPGPILERTKDTDFLDMFNAC
jgi:hypothetical protein